MRNFLLTKFILIFFYACGTTQENKDNSVENPISTKSPADNFDPNSFSNPHSESGTQRDYPNIFSLLATNLVEFASEDEGNIFCEDELNLGSVFRYPSSSSSDAYEYVSCLGYSLEKKTANNLPSYFKAFKSDPNFFRQFSGFVHLQYLDSQTVKATCLRFPEDRSNEKTFSVSEPLEDLCGSVFAFKFHINDPQFLKDASIVFAGGGPEALEFGQFK